MPDTKIMHKVYRVLHNNSCSKNDLIDGLYFYVARHGKIPFNVKAQKEQYASYLLNKAMDKKPTITISNRKQYNNWVNNGDY